QQLQATRKAEGEATRRLYASLLDQARANRLTGPMGQRYDSLKILAEAARLGSLLQLEARERLTLRREAIAVLALPAWRVWQEWPVEPPLGTRFAFDARLERYARYDAQGNLLVHEVASPGKVLRLSGPGRLPRDAWFHFSPDGRYLAVRKDL